MEGMVAGGEKSYSSLISRIFQRVLRSRTTSGTMAWTKSLSSSLKDRKDGEVAVMGGTLVYMKLYLVTMLLFQFWQLYHPHLPEEGTMIRTVKQFSQTPARGGKQRPGSPSFGREEKACLCSLLLMVSSVKTLLRYLVCLSILYPWALSKAQNGARCLLVHH